MIGVVATIKVKAGMEKEFEAVAKELVAKVNASEPGCKLYALHHGEAPLTYVFMERYADQAAVDAHRGTEYFKALGVRWASIWTAAPRWCGSAKSARAEQQRRDASCGRP